jgi:UDP-3-O-acyl-N-acetylglucosamine deacetylase
VTRFTVAESSSLEGVGLHLGEPCRLTFRPAAAGQGIVLKRIDIEGAEPIKATVDQVTET